MKITDERIRSVLEKVAQKLKIKQWSYIKHDIDDNIENYFGILIPVTLIGIDKDSEVRKPVFIKFAPNDIAEELKPVIKQHYEVEAHTYCQLIPIYKQISKVDVQNIMPDCYYADLEPNNEVIVLKDMRCEGFRRFDGNRYLDADHLDLSLETLAKFNALSIIFKENESGFDSTIMQPYTDKHPEIYFNYIKNALNNHIHLFENTVYEKYYKRLNSDLAHFVKTASSEAKYLIYGHGDFWKENILFKYKNSKPIRACILDFQKSRKMSPAQDVLCFLLTNTEHLDIVQHQVYLNIYLDSLHRTLAENGVDKVYTADDLKYDMKIVAPYCSAIAIMAFSLWFGLQYGGVVESKHTSKDADNDLILFKNTVMDKLDQLNNFGYITL